MAMVKSDDMTPLISDDMKSKDVGYKALSGKQAESWNLCDLFQHDIIYRSKLMRTFAVWYAYFVCGWVIAQGGPAFPDLRLITGTNLQTGSLLFSLGSFGYLIGCLFGGILYDRFNTTLVIFVSTFGLTVSSGFFPWSSNFAVMLVIRVLVMIFNGAVDTVCNADVLGVWGSKARPYFAALHFTFTVGGTLAPLVTQIFLAPTGTIEDNAGSVYPTNNTFGVYYEIKKVNVTESKLAMNSKVLDAEIVYSNTSSSPVITSDDTMVQFSYIVTAVIGLIASIPFLVIFVKEKCCARATSVEKQTSVTEDKYPVLSWKKKLFYLFLMALIFLAYTAVEDTLEGYLATFCLSQLNWTTQDASVITSIFWAGLSVANFGAIFLIAYIDPSKAIIVFYSFAIISFSCLIVASIFNIVPLVWISVPAIGVSLSILFPAQFTWIQENLMPVSGRIASIMMVSSSIGTFLNPLLLGYLMENITPMWFCYLLCGECVLGLVTFLTVFTLSRVDKKSSVNNSLIVRTGLNNHRDYGATNETHFDK